MAVTTDSLLGPTTGQLILEVDSGDGEARKYCVSDSKCAIGVDERCGIQIQGEGIRPVHCVILRSHDRTIVRRWAGNTWLNGRPFEDTTLRRGDELRLANIRIRVIRDERFPSNSGASHRGTRLRQALAKKTDWSSSRASWTTPRRPQPATDLVRRLADAEACLEELRHWNEVARDSSEHNDSQLASRIAALESMMEDTASEQTVRFRSTTAEYDDAQSRDWDQEPSAWQREKSELEETLSATNRRLAEVDSERETLGESLERLAAELEGVKQARDEAERDRDEAVAQLDARQGSGEDSVDLDERETAWQAKLDELEAEREADEAVNKQYQDDLQQKIKELGKSLAESEARLDRFHQQVEDKNAELSEIRRQLVEQESVINELSDEAATDRLADLQQRWVADSHAWEEERELLCEQIAAYETAAAQRQALTAEYDALSARNEALVVERDEAIAARDEAVAERDALETERDEVVTERDEIEAARTQGDLEVERLVAERDKNATELETLEKKLGDLIAERDAAISKCDAATSKRDELMREWDQLVVGHDELLNDRDDVVIERDAARKEVGDLVTQRDEAVAQRDKLAVERDEAVAERDEVVAERDEVVAERDKLAVERDEAVAERDEAVAERDKLAVERDEAVAQRDKLLAERDEAVTERDELAEQIAVMTPAEVGLPEESAAAAEVERLRQELSREREEIEQLKRQLEQRHVQVDLESYQETAPPAVIVVPDNSNQGYVDVALDYASQLNDDAGVAEIAPQLIKVGDDDDSDEGAPEELAALRHLDRLTGEESSTSSSLGEKLTGEQIECPLDDGEIEGDNLSRQFESELDNEYSESTTTAEHPVPVSDDEDVEQSGRSGVPVEDESTDDEWDKDDEVEEALANVFIQEVDTDGDDSRDEGGEGIGARSHTAGMDPGLTAINGSDSPVGDIDESEDTATNHDETGPESTAAELEVATLATGVPVFTDDDSIDGPANRENTRDFLGKLGEKPDFGLSIEPSDNGSPAEDNGGASSDAADEDSPADSTNRENTHDFLSQLGEKPDFGLSTDASDVDPDGEDLAGAAPDSIGEDSPNDPTTGENTRDFLSQLGEKPDFGLSSDVSDVDSAGEDLGGATPDSIGEDSSSDPVNGENTHDFLSKLGEKPDFGLSAESSDADPAAEDLWGESTSSAKKGLASEAAKPEDTQDFLSMLGEISSLRSSLDASDTAVATESPASEDAVVTDDERSHEDSDDAQDFLSRLGEKPDLEPSTSHESAAASTGADSLWDESSLFDDENPTDTSDDDPHAFLSKLGQKPDVELVDSSDEDSWDDTQIGDVPINEEDAGTLDFLHELGESTHDAMPTDAGPELDEWGLPIERSPQATDAHVGMATESFFHDESSGAHSDDMISTPEQEVVLTAGDPDEGGNIEDYMESLLSFTEGDASGNPHAEVPVVEASEAEPSVFTEADVLAEKQLATASSEFLPRTKAPEENLDAMRELANASTRSAIRQAQWSRAAFSLVTNIGLSLIPVLMGLILIVFGLNGRYIVLASGIVFLVVGAYMICNALTVLSDNKDTVVPASQDTDKS